MNQGNKESHGQCNISNIYTILYIYVCVSERERQRETHRDRQMERPNCGVKEK